MNLHVPKLKRTAAAAMIVAAFVFTLHGMVTAQESQTSQNLSQGMTNAAGEEIVTPVSGFSAIVTLNDENLSRLLKHGAVEIAIPQQLIHSVDSVMLKRPLFFKDKQASVIADANLEGNKLVVNVDETMLERIDYQPIDLQVYETGFSAVVIRLVGQLPGKFASDDYGDPEKDSPLVLVKLKSGKGITGRISEMRTFKVDSTLGVIDVDIESTGIIRVATDGRLMVEMPNGDLVSGTISTEQIELITRWQNETIALSDIDSFVAKKVLSRRANNRNSQAAGVRKPSTQVTSPASW